MAWAVFLLVGSAVCTICSVSAQEANLTDTVGSNTVIVGAVEHAVYLKKKEDGSYEGFDQDVLDEISKLTGLDFRIKPPDDGRYGMQVDGQWSGMVQELIDKKIDMAMGLYITAMRERHIDFSKPLLAEHMEMLIKKPMTVQTEWYDQTYGIMTTEVQFIVLVSFLLVSIVTFVIIRVSPYENRAYSAEVGEASRLSTFGHCLWLCFSAFGWQGVDYSPRSLSGRFLFVFWFLFVGWTLLLLTGALAGFFLATASAAPVPTVPVQSFDDLAATRAVRPALVSGGGGESFFKDSQVSSYRRIYEKAIKVTSSEDGVKRARLGRTAFITTSTVARYHSNRKPCDLVSVHDAQSSLGSRSIGIGVQKDSPLRDRLSLAILQLREDGTIHTLYKKWTGELEEQCDNSQFSGGPRSKQPGRDLYYRQLGVRDMLPIFVIVVVAAILALCIMGAEVLWDKRQSKATRKAAPPDNMTGACEDTNI
ncbi:GRIK4 [Branchiostoma lanceolatum]|uniref:GRIK4 protein n=1 Tax=Branchiostoma lanceolatum TaxID=7740 RepID=A0A8J9ZFF6_BRALA|nr:GRIK4 [Branchiostoma lanceolatum]